MIKAHSSAEMVSGYANALKYYIMYMLPIL